VGGLTSYRDLAALVTGASSGIGRALALRLAREGARVALVARREAELEAVASGIRAAGREALVLPCDVADPEGVAAVAVRALERFGRIDLLVNNAGYGRHCRFLDWDLADAERMLRVNTLGAVYVTKALLPQMVERGHGWVVFMASVAGRIAPPEESVYAASKFALVGLAEALSLEVEERGVHVLTVCPGAIRTPFFDATALGRLPPVARRWMAEPEPLVDAIVAALAAGRRELTFPRRMAPAYAVRALAPGLMRRMLRRSTLDALARERKRQEARGDG
jgi:short-subunit dehydrogenase